MVRKLFLLISLFPVIVAAGCGSLIPDLPENGTVGSPSELNSNQKVLTVMTAASLTEAFTELGGLFEVENPGVEVLFNFAGSQQLAQQILSGAQADVFASAGDRPMDNVIGEGANLGAPRIFIYNQMTIVLPSDNPAGIISFADLAVPGVKLVLAASGVPAGDYALQVLDKAAESSDFGPAFREAVLANIVSYEVNVRAVLTKVAIGEADAGIVYTSDVSILGNQELNSVDIPEELNITAAYPIVVLRSASDPPLAEAFVQLVLSPVGQEVMEKFGFIPIE